MTKRIFKNTMLIVFIVVVLCSISILAVVYSYYNKEISKNMIDQGDCISAGVEMGGMDYLNNMEDVNIRVTWVDVDGTVLYDNRVDVSTMDNHADRVEIKAAMTSSTGNSERYSSTISEKTMYHATRLSDGSVLRVATTQKSILLIVASMMAPVVVVIILALVLTGFLAYRLSKQIIKPLEDINLDHPEESEVYDEMSPFVRKIIIQNEEIKKNMDALSAQKKEFELITKNMQEGFVVIDKEGKVLSHNQSALRLFGVKENAECKTVLTLNRSEDFDKAVKIALSGRHNERVIGVGERFYNIYLNPVLQQELVAGAVIVVTDVTEKEERENLRREFSANVSHELKTPLTAISGTAEIIKSGIVAAEDIPKFADNIYNEAGRLINLVEDIINLSKLDEGDASFVKESINLKELANEIKERLDSTAQKRNIEIQVQGEDITILGIKSVVDEMIYNLCDNAVKYNVDGGSVVMSIKKGHEQNAVVSISDTGIGIEKNQQARIFERFYRVDKSHSKTIGGTGLGLSIVKHGAKLHNARISVDSELGEGTTISVEF